LFGFHVPAMAQKYYESDLTKMIRELLREKPQIVEEQKKGRAMWWDKKLNLDEQKREEESSVKQQAYVYQNKV
jgi:Protein of unknown function (DUF3460)